MENVERFEIPVPRRAPSARPSLVAPVAVGAGDDPTAAAALPPGVRARRGDVPPGSPEAQGLIGDHPTMRRVRELISRIACDPAPVLIHGESGTGKELVADALHARSRRSSEPLVKVNCGGLTDGLLASALFGHERGAFTSAVERGRGCFEAAHRGTLFLDEIGDASPRAQAALLRVLQCGRFERLGASTPIEVDVRVVCATNRSLADMVALGTFREDLYYRLEAIRIDLPPLRERPEDIPLIAAHLLERLARQRGAPVRPLDDGAQAELMRMRWPGNVRQLENVLRAASLFAEGASITGRDVERQVARGRAAGPGEFGVVAWEQLTTGRIGLRGLQKEIEVECLRRALAATRGNIARAAAMLQMKRPRVSQLAKEHALARGP